ncbi:MAG: YfiR family protein [Acidobacteriia bacterium]|nr:YfiR family protein [Terriglobia bacterium]
MPSILSKRLIASLAWLALLPALYPAAGEPEDELKAAVVLSFLRYAEWPQPFASNAPIRVGVLGPTSFTEVLRGALEGKSVNEHALRVAELKSVGEAAGCQVVYFATDKAEEIKMVLQAASAAHVLSIGEDKDFLRRGGAVNLLVVDGQMSFEVDLEALERSGVNISSRLLRFGQVRNRKKGDRS